MSPLSNWREESDLFEVVTGKMTDKEALKKVSEKKGIKNKVIINPKLSEAVKELGGELIEASEEEQDTQQDEKDKAAQKQIEAKQKRGQMIKKQVLLKKLMAVRAGSQDIVASYEPDIEGVIEYFYEEGINEEGFDQILEEIGLEEFVDFVEGGAVELNEERAARRASVRAKKFPQVKAEVDKADAAKKKAKKGEYAPSYAKKETDVTVYDDKAPAKKKVAAKKPVAKKVAPKPVAKKPVTKKVVKAVAKVKKTQPAKKPSKAGLGDRIRTAYKKGVERHKKARAAGRVPEKRAREFASGVKSGVKTAVKFAKDVKKVVGEEVGVSSSAAMAKARKEAELKAKEEAAVKKQKDSTRKEEVVLEKDLSAAERRALPDKDFALPGKGKGPQGKQAGSYPIPDEKHARSALSLVSQHGTSAEKATVRAKVKKKFPGIKMAEDKALEIVRANIIKKHGKGAIYDPKRDKPSAADNAKAAAERKKRDAEKSKAFAARAKKAGYKSTQDYANVVARYGSEDNMKKGTGLGS